MKIWTLREWNDDRSIRTVWIIKDSVLSKATRFSNHPFRNGMSNNSLRLLSLFADEAHIFCRSNTSQRSKTYRDLLRLSEFSVYISGTPFPYGIRSDARVVLQHIGGSLVEDGTDGKWTPLQRNTFSNLLSDNRRWDTRIFRILISVFCLRRTTESRWDNQWIIPRSVVRPTPLERPPTAEDLWDSETKKEMKRLGKGFSNATLSDRIERADKLRCLMWSPEVYYQIMQHTQGKLADCQNLIEQAMTSTLFSYRPTSRLYELIGLIRGCFERKKGFIIVADRLYLVTMAAAVSPLMSFANEKVCDKMGLKVGILAGTNIFGSKTTARDEAVSQLNAGSLDGMIITPGVGGTGLNMTGACVMIFMGSAYSISSERQCVCMFCGE